MSNPYQKYKKTAVESASKEKLLLMLYEAAIRFTKQAIEGAETKNISLRAKKICAVYDIVVELNNTLDHKVGGEIAKNLEQLYMFITDQLTKANVSGDPAPLKVVLGILETLHAGWAEAIEKLKKEDQMKGAGGA